MMKREEKLLFDALQFANIVELPAETVKENTAVWVRGIAKVVNRCNEVSYAVVRNVYGKAPQFIKMFDNKGVRDIVDIYPYTMLDMSFAAGITKIEHLRGAVAQVYNRPYAEVKALSKEELKILFYNYGIKLQEKGIIKPIEIQLNTEDNERNSESEAGAEAE